jgi:hypothetical protein
MIALVQSNNWHRNATRCHGSELPCCICGKPIKNPDTAQHVHVVDGGDMLALPGIESESLVGSSGDCGGHPIGMCCLRQHPEYKPYVFERERS